LFEQKLGGSEDVLRHWPCGFLWWSASRREGTTGEGDHRMTRPNDNLSETWLAPGLTAEGTITGNGNVRLAAQFMGTINVTGTVAIDAGATVEGEVQASHVLISGCVRGQILSRSRVDLKETGTVIGEVKAETVTVAAGSKMQATIECGDKLGAPAYDAGASLPDRRGGSAAPRAGMTVPT
jgi:cytoskeletal protein CcmA (bactofilin family)